MAWTAPEVERPSGDLDADELTLVTGLLAWHRQTLLAKCAGLDARQLAMRSVPPSNLSLLGLLRHLAKVERIWFRERAAGEDIAPLYGGAGNDTDFEELDLDAEAAWTTLVEEVRASERVTARLGLDHTFEHSGRTFSLRFVHLHMIGEYARHNGHADFLREQIDGVTGA